MTAEEYSAMRIGYCEKDKTHADAGEIMSNHDDTISHSSPKPKGCEFFPGPDMLGSHSLKLRR